MTVDIRILAQYKENYGFFEGTTRWKMKGGAEFVIKGVDDSVMYYRDEEVDRVINQMLAKRSNDHCAYELISWELIFGQATEISADEFMVEMQSLVIS
jgi:hypothetical protein